MAQTHRLVETDPPEPGPDLLARRIAELERLTHEPDAPYAGEIARLRAELEKGLPGTARG